MFTCRSCKKTDLEVHEMKPDRSLLPTHRGVCKPCASDYQKHWVMLKKANKNPENYLTCDDCDRIFCKYNVGNKWGVNGHNFHTKDENVSQKLRVDCPFCKSENISRY